MTAVSVHERARSFAYRDVVVDATAGTITCDYACDGVAFEETATFDEDVDLRASSVESAAMLYHLLAGLSYYKAFAARRLELGVHPIDSSGPATGTTKLSLMCDDIERTVTELRAKGAVVSGEISDQGYGLVTSITVPGGVALDLYQPRHATAFDLEG